MKLKFVFSLVFNFLFSKASHLLSPPRGEAGRGFAFFSPLGRGGQTTRWLFEPDCARREGPFYPSKVIEIKSILELSLSIEFEKIVLSFTNIFLMPILSFASMANLKY